MTSPSGRHLGHYKTIIKDKLLLKCLTQALQITVQSGLTLRRWCNAVNILIEKDPGKPKITRLRIIHLFEADFNLFLKLIWGSRLVKGAVFLNLLNDGQHGSTPQKKATDPIMLTQLTVVAYSNRTGPVSRTMLLHATTRSLSPLECWQPVDAAWQNLQSRPMRTA